VHIKVVKISNDDCSKISYLTRIAPQRTNIESLSVLICE